MFDPGVTFVNDGAIGDLGAVRIFLNGFAASAADATVTGSNTYHSCQPLGGSAVTIVNTGHVHLVFPDNTVDVYSVITNVVTRVEGRWVFTHIHTDTPPPPA